MHTNASVRTTTHPHARKRTRMHSLPPPTPTGKQVLFSFLYIHSVDSHHHHCTRRRPHPTHVSRLYFIFHVSSPSSCVYPSIRVDLYAHTIASTVIQRTALSKFFPFLFSLPSPTSITIYVRTHAHATQQHAIVSTMIHRTVLSKFFSFLFYLPSPMSITIYVRTHAHAMQQHTIASTCILHPVSFFSFLPFSFLFIYR